MRGGLTPLQRSSQCILQPKPTGQSLKEFGPQKESCYEAGTKKIMDEVKIRGKNIKLLLSKLNVSKSIGPKINLKILKYLSSNESLINPICKLRKV